MPSLFEAARERELYLYYQPQVSQSTTSSDLVPRSSTDTALSAFAQLATLRLDTRRALISVLSRNEEHILAESTQTLSSQSDLVHNDQDELWFGCSNISRSQGLCGQALELFSVAEPRPLIKRSLPLVVNDISRDARFEGCSFVQTRPSVRFFAAMPICTKSGFEIGTLSVMDERSREGLSDKEMIFLEDMATTIMDHLEMCRVKEAARRGERMVKGLGLFVDGRSQLREWWLDGTSSSNANTDLDSFSTTEETAQTEAVVPETSALPSIAISPSSNSGVLRLNPGTPTRTSPPALEVKTKTEDGEDPATGSTYQMRKVAPDLQTSMLSANLKDMFSRASNIIRECIEVHGTLFLDASIGTFSGHTGQSHRNFDRFEGSEQERPQGSNPIGNSEDLRKKCGVLGFSKPGKSYLKGDEAPESYTQLPEVFLRRLIQKYPRGQVFDFDELGIFIPRLEKLANLSPEVADANVAQTKTLPGRLPELIARDDETYTEATTILRMLPGARSVAFSTLWDSHRERHFASCFAWTKQSTRVLRPTEDLNYLAAFGNSIMVEVAQLDSLAADQAKSDFISSISHELRTPLHGILASVEFLQDTAADLFQISMIDTIERCGRTLLDTIQHVLDFAKINFNQRKDAKSMPSTEGTTSIQIGSSIDIDISLVTEDVIDSMYVGFEFAGKSSLVPVLEITSPYEPVLPKKDRVEVIMDIAWESNWGYNTQSGAVRRILMNLLGNSLKYTEAGWIKVSLQCQDVEPASNRRHSFAHPHQTVIIITVSDSGRGISQEFVQGHMFTPFIQENSLNPGVGLGMSIVKSIVSSLGGQIDITSEQGVGTKMKVSLPLTKVPLLQLPSGVIYEHPAFSARKKTKGLKVGLVGFDFMYSGMSKNSPGSDAKSAALMFLQTAIESMAIDWFGMEVSPPAIWKISPPDIYIVNETPQPQNASSGVPTIVLCSSASTYRTYAAQKNAKAVQDKEHGYIYFVSKPCGPHKLAKAFEFCLGSDSRSRSNLNSLDSWPIPPMASSDSSHQSLFDTSPPDWIGSPLRSSPRNQGEQRDSYFPRTLSSIPTKSTVTPSPSIATLLPQETPVTEPRKPLLLLVDDNAVNLRLLETFMKKSRFEYDTAVNGLLAVQAYQSAERPHDIIFMDISMPVMDGMQASHEIRNLEQSLGLTPAIIIALTGLASAEAQQEAFSNGIDLFLTKPVRFSDLRKILKEWTAPMAKGGDKT